MPQHGFPFRVHRSTKNARPPSPRCRCIFCRSGRSGSTCDSPCSSTKSTPVTSTQAVTLNDFPSLVVTFDIRSGSLARAAPSPSRRSVAKTDLPLRTRLIASNWVQRFTLLSGFVRELIEHGQNSTTASPARRLSRSAAVSDFVADEEAEGEVVAEEGADDAVAVGVVPSELLHPPSTTAAASATSTQDQPGHLRLSAPIRASPCRSHPPATTAECNYGGTGSTLRRAERKPVDNSGGSSVSRPQQHFVGRAGTTRGRSWLGVQQGSTATTSPSSTAAWPAGALTPHEHRCPRGQRGVRDEASARHQPPDAAVGMRTSSRSTSTGSTRIRRPLR